MLFNFVREKVSCLSTERYGEIQMGDVLICLDNGKPAGTVVEILKITPPAVFEEGPRYHISVRDPEGMFGAGVWRLDDNFWRCYGWTGKSNALKGQAKPKVIKPARKAAAVKRNRKKAA